MVSKDVFQACTRFGLGAHADELSQISDPKGWLMAQLASPAIPPEVQMRVGGNRLAKDEAGKKRVLLDANHNEYPIHQVYLEESFARFTAQRISRQPFIERLVLFWSNHFAVSMQKGIVAGIVNRYEAEAIRPYVTGYFKDMLLATTKHPAMLLYLDNAQSIGPNSIAGLRRSKGLNENLAREIMELHTLGVNSGYTQADVTNFARILTGWSLVKGNAGERILEYQFQPLLHEPGNKTLLARTITEAGEEEGVEALNLFASHPATARHIATKLARYFISDEPPVAAINKLEASFIQSGGHLGEMAKTLISLNESWQSMLTKFKDPYDYVLSIHRLIDFQPEQKAFFSSLDALGYRLFNATSPAGYADSVSEWASPGAVKKRIEYAYRFAQRMPALSDPQKLAAQAIGPVLKPETEQAIKRAASGKDGIALLFSSPEFLRR